MFRSLALTNLAVVYERMADWKKAAGAYQQAAADPGPEQVRAELGVARMLAKSGDKQGAIAAYRGFLNAHPFAQQRQDVMESLALLGAPADIAPPSLAPAASPQPVRHSLVATAQFRFSSVIGSYPRRFASCGPATPNVLPERRRGHTGIILTIRARGGL